MSPKKNARATRTAKGFTSPKAKRLKLCKSKSITEFFKGDSDAVSSSSDATSKHCTKSQNKSAKPGNVQSSSIAFCPSCQMPFSALIMQSEEEHSLECLETEKNRQQECPDGIYCTSKLISHYSDFSHFKLAEFRSFSRDKDCNDIPVCSLVESDIQIVNDGNVITESAEISVLNSTSTSIPFNVASSSTSLPVSSANNNQTITPESEKPSELKSVFQATITSFFTGSSGNSAPVKPVLLKDEKLSAPSSAKHSKCLRASSASSGFAASSENIVSGSSFAVSDNYESYIPSSGKNKCPFYKKIPNTGFVVDAFSYGTIPNVTCYFLSHFHWDHYYGLTKNFSSHLYCSEVTANLVLLKIRVQRKYVHPLSLYQTHVIENVKVTLLTANHCPGSVMFLFGLPNGSQVLHTGDFRADSQMESSPFLKSIAIDHLYLDTTYCDPAYDFPSQEAILEFVTSVALERVSKNPNILIVCGSYTIGKEKVFLSIAQALDCKIWADGGKQRVLKCLNDKVLDARLTARADEAQIHVLPMMKLKFQFLDEYLSKFKKASEILAYKPTGWEHRSSITNETLHKIKPSVRGPVTIYGVPYSEHSSFNELKQFVQFILPKKVIPTVGMGNPKSRSKINSIINAWMNK